MTSLTHKLKHKVDIIVIISLYHIQQFYHILMSRESLQTDGTW